MAALSFGFVFVLSHLNYSSLVVSSRGVDLMYAHAELQAHAGVVVNRLHHYYGAGLFLLLQLPRGQKIF